MKNLLRKSSEIHYNKFTARFSKRCHSGGYSSNGNEQHKLRT